MGKHTDIRWREWGEESFREAKETDRAVLLDLSAVWCHWCHVMDETSYSDDEVIQLINENFVPIRVDIDRRPDIRERYNFGGYPTTAFLNGEGEVITGGTYIPPDQMKRTLMQVKRYMESGGGKVRERRVPESEVEPPKGPLNLDIVEDVLGHLLQQFDDLHGGFGSAPKFPQPEAIDLALYQFKLSGNRHFRRVVERTLGAMAGGGVYDRTEGGFFRYSVTRDWSEPHYEKMLDVNVGLLGTYLNAYALLGEPSYREIAVDIMRYLEGSLRDSGGGFYGSQDADEEYYRMSGKERAEAKPPYIDKTLYTDLNGRAVSSYLRASAVLGDEKYLRFGLDALQVLQDRLLRENGTLYHYWDGKSQVDGLLADYVYLSKAFLEAYEHTGENLYLDRCTAIVGRMLNDLGDESGLLLDRKPSETDLGLLKAPQRPLVDNAHAATMLLKLHELGLEKGYGDAATKILTGFSGQYSRYSIFASPYAIAVSTYLRGPLRLDLVGNPEDGEVRQIASNLLASYEPRRVVHFLEPGTREFQEARYPTEPVPAVYACVGAQCSAPLTGPDIVRDVVAFLSKADVKGNSQNARSRSSTG